MPINNPWTAREIQLERLIVELTQWANAQRAIWGDDWAQKILDLIDRQARDARRRITANANEFDRGQRDFQREFERRPPPSALASHGDGMVVNRGAALGVCAAAAGGDGGVIRRAVTGPWPCGQPIDPSELWDLVTTTQIAPGTEAQNMPPVIVAGEPPSNSGNCTYSPPDRRLRDARAANA
jgi:hypothetical protein